MRLFYFILKFSPSSGKSEILTKNLVKFSENLSTHSNYILLSSIKKDKKHN